MRVLIAKTLCLCAFAAGAQAQTPSWRIGEYKLVAGSATSGSLVVRSVQRDMAEFDLVSLQCVSHCGNPDLENNHNGIVEEGQIKLSGRKGTYVSSQEEDKELGHCMLHFQIMTHQLIRVRQAGNCWWFGVGVDASGTYRLQESKAQLGV